MPTPSANRRLPIADRRETLRSRNEARQELQQYTVHIDFNCQRAWDERAPDVELTDVELRKKGVCPECNPDTPAEVNEPSDVAAPEDHDFNEVDDETSKVGT